MSLIQITASRSRLPAWLGLFALLLLFIAPVISKSLAQARGGDMPIMMKHHGEMAMEGMHHKIMMSKVAMTLPHHMSMTDDSACGYCVLLIHLPLSLVNLPPLWSLLQAASKPTAHPGQPLFNTFTPIHFRSRAPPSDRYFLN